MCSILQVSYQPKTDIEFGMSSTLLSFWDKYYVYHGGERNGEQALAIGGYKSAFLADLVARYLLEKSQDLFSDDQVSKGIYCDDGIYVTTTKWTAADLRAWLTKFQARVDEIAESKHISFTGVLWDLDHPIGKEDKVDSSQSFKRRTNA
mmetsp:Transcript_30140/g.36840  ORF Transcript_30140/g.36840 Transcript_30140/m.36840 type:complete len:149 (+) Transcript_30140:213-659(+)|eukprot:CAMPEP_0172491182 /NCGR_PEP_ID=MMETSP1066-20121228/21900_1 /TAXON_ID=671091 /ORGANISM="Coscinodiscus wailesii, Strain CCMP2513" /LENGTH=148 /DNA_ID=CAMNT_0013260089 /DNA_START=207 /DNA_END=653 /DNA_ORIENTATION=-